MKTPNFGVKTPNTWFKIFLYTVNPQTLTDPGTSCFVSQYIFNAFFALENL